MPDTSDPTERDYPAAPTPALAPSQADRVMRALEQGDGNPYLDAVVRGAVGAPAAYQVSPGLVPATPTFELTPSQRAAADLALSVANGWGAGYVKPEAGATIVGFAGVGKSVVLSQIARELGDGNPNLITVLAPTGKAALRLRAAGIESARTIHRWCYTPIENPATGKIEFIFKPKEPPYRGVVLIDEGSMVGSEVADDVQKALTQLRARAVVMGDGFQLAPVGGKPGDSILSRWEENHPTARLTEILRQAGDSPVIQASLAIRSGQVDRAFALLPEIDPRRLPQAIPRMIERGGVIICHRNETRQAVNRKARAAFGRKIGAIEPGEPLLVLQNTYAVDAYNGECVEFLRWIVPPAMTGGEDGEGRKNVTDRFKKKTVGIRFGCAQVSVRGVTQAVVLALETVYAIPDLVDFYQGAIYREADGWARDNVEDAYWTEVDVEDEDGEITQKRTPPPYLQCHFGYAYTCHKMQGSQAPNVLVLVEPTVKLGKTDGQRWLYTAVTRAQKNAALCALPNSWR